MTASAIPVKPPTAWFGNPGFGQLEPLTVTSDGRIAGHIASWREDHIGMSGRVKAPKSKSGYAFFATGCVETAEGKLVNCGQITLTGGHAPLEASVAEAVAHYDNTDSAFADVSVGEDRHGIWVAGALRPTVDDVQLRAIRAASVSGDWRPINGSLEMVAVCAVNVPGFPIPRARVAAGQPVALVAAGTGELVDLALHQDSGVADEIAGAFDDRLRFMEDVVLGRIGDRREVLDAAVASAKTGLDLDDTVALLAAFDHRDTIATQVTQARVDVDKVAALRASVHPEREDRIASLRASVHGPSEDDRIAALRASAHGPQLWDDGMPIELEVGECLQAALRARVNGPHRRPGHESVDWLKPVRRRPSRVPRCPAADTRSRTKPTSARRSGRSAAARVTTARSVATSSKRARALARWT